MQGIQGLFQRYHIIFKQDTFHGIQEHHIGLHHQVMRESLPNITSYQKAPTIMSLQTTICMDSKMQIISKCTINYHIVPKHNHATVYVGSRTSHA